MPRLYYGKYSVIPDPMASEAQFFRFNHRDLDGMSAEHLGDELVVVRLQLARERLRDRPDPWAVAWLDRRLTALREERAARESVDRAPVALRSAPPSPHRRAPEPQRRVRR